MRQEIPSLAIQLRSYEDFPSIRNCRASAYDYGKGRVCYMSPGHMLTVLWNPEYVKLQHNAVRWLLRQSS
jgi:hypothetical protein